MKINQSTGRDLLELSTSDTLSNWYSHHPTALSTPKLLLLPYSAHHVPTYHEWMQSPTLQALTASEPLTLEEEYAMQRSWRTDADKLTFIICQPLPPDSPSIKGGVVRGSQEEEMIGDINLFLSSPDHDDDDDDDGGGVGERNRDGKDEGGVVGEIELMIAVRSLHRQGFGRASLLTFLSYILTHWAEIAAEYATSTTLLRYLRVRINETNGRSIALFESTGFLKTTEKANYFGELELRWRPSMTKLRESKGWESLEELRYEEPEDTEDRVG